MRCIERGLTIFDLPADRTRADRDQWVVILDWLDSLWSREELAATPSQADALMACPADAKASAAPRATRPMPGSRSAAGARDAHPPPARAAAARTGCGAGAARGCRPRARLVRAGPGLAAGTAAR
ncbi:MAG: hypothetical protein MZW92_72885 [Comamonadaceae bacterium]|nr:hypothetical protein [Comamonadaceae bacterium]